MGWRFIGQGRQGVHHLHKVVMPFIHDIQSKKNAAIFDPFAIVASLG